MTTSAAVSVAGQRERGEQAHERDDPQRAAEHAPRRHAAHVAAGAAEQGEAAARLGARARQRREAAGGADDHEHQEEHAADDQQHARERRPVQAGDEAGGQRPRGQQRAQRRLRDGLRGQRADERRARRGHPPPQQQDPQRVTAAGRQHARRAGARDPDQHHVAAARTVSRRVGGTDDRVPAAPTGKLRAEVQHHARDQPQEVDVPEGQARTILPVSSASETGAGRMSRPERRTFRPRPGSRGRPLTAAPGGATGGGRRACGRPRCRSRSRRR